VEAGDAAAATEPLEAGFRGPDGLDKGSARWLLTGTLRQEKVGVTVVRNQVAVRGNQAMQEVDLLLTSRQGGLLPREASQRSFSLRWVRTRGDWYLAELQPIDGR